MTKLVPRTITGAGHFLAETFAIMMRLVDRYDVKVTTSLSEAATETVRIYGFAAD